jgi:hypothetical protein
VRVRCLIALGAAALPALAGAQPAPAPPAHSLEERVSRLRNKLAPANARLRDLHEKVGAELAQGTRAVLLHRDELGTPYELESASYTIDGVGREGPAPTARAARGSAEVVLERRLDAGAHRASAELVYRVRAGADAPPRRFEVRSSHAFEAEPGATTRLTLVTHERAGPEVEEVRAAVRFEVEVVSEAAAEGADAGAPAAGP